jgi:hypothetical protein
MKVFNVVLTLSFLILVGCHSYSKYDYAREFVDNLNYESGKLDDFELDKTYTLQGSGWIIVEDKYGDDYAIDIYSYVRDSYLYDLDYFDDYAIEVHSVGLGLWEDYYGNLYEQGNESGKDLEKIAAQLENIKLEAVGEGISAKYGLSLDRGLKLAKIASNWKKASKTRTMTDADTDSLSQELFGFDLGQGIKAFEEYNRGDSTNFDELIKKAAQTNGITPEHINRIFKEYVL